MREVADKPDREIFARAQDRKRLAACQLAWPQVAQREAKTGRLAEEKDMVELFKSVIALAKNQKGRLTSSILEADVSQRDNISVGRIRKEDVSLAERLPGGDVNSLSFRFRDEDQHFGLEDHFHGAFRG
jgi:hypothetical protein